MEHDLIIIGAGPAGMAAALTAAEYGANVLVLDEQRKPGGQIYRAIEDNDATARPELGQSYFAGQALTKAFRAAQVEYAPGSVVWHVSGDGEVGYTQNEAAQLVRAPHVIIATGAMERPFPVPGWTKAGVMTVGAAQILLKGSGIGIKNAVFAGTGALLYLVVHQYMQAGIPVKAVLDLTPSANYRSALRHLPNAMSSVGKIAQGLRWKRGISRAGVPFISGIEDIRISGEGSAEAVEYLKKGTWTRIDTSSVLLHQGVVPNVNISMAAGCDSSWDPQQAAWVIKVDDWFQSSQPCVSVVGDGAAISGAVAAENAGRLAALGVLNRLDRIDTPTRDRRAVPFRKAHTAELRLRPFLDTLFRPACQFRVPAADDTIVCRCEEISAGQIREVVALGCAGPNQLKSFSRCGMGPCQGRFCGHTVSELIAKAEGKPVGDVGYYRLRPPIKPLHLEELAKLSPQEHPE